MGNCQCYSQAQLSTLSSSTEGYVICAVITRSRLSSALQFSVFGHSRRCPITLPRLCTAINRPRKKRRERERAKQIGSIKLTLRIGIGRSDGCTVGRSSGFVVLQSTASTIIWATKQATHCHTPRKSIRSCGVPRLHPRHVCH